MALEVWAEPAWLSSAGKVALPSLTVNIIDLTLGRGWQPR